MAWYFHIVELASGQWACRHGNTEYDRHADMEQAIAHMRRFASENSPASIMVHRRDGTVEQVDDSESDA